MLPPIHTLPSLPEGPFLLPDTPSSLQPQLQAPPQSPSWESSPSLGCFLFLSTWPSGPSSRCPLPLQGSYFLLLSPAHFQADKWLRNERMNPSIFPMYSLCASCDQRHHLSPPSIMTPMMIPQHLKDTILNTAACCLPGFTNQSSDSESCLGQVH